MTKKVNNPIQAWGEQINWDKRIKAICKPCWEIKYCPYGPLVEDSPLKEVSDEKSCRIFGHDCPVFHVAEPLTETKELRNIGRSIPRVTQFRVMKRENQICSICGKSVKDGEIEFDHIIPWSKGGSSDENNVTLLCMSCNRKKGKKFEDKYLIESLSDHLQGPAPFDLLKIFLDFTSLLHESLVKENKHPTSVEFTKFWGRRKVTRADEAAVEISQDIEKFFSTKKPEEIGKKIFNALSYRWGFDDGKIHKIKEVVDKFKIKSEDFIKEENYFLKRLGFSITLTTTIQRKWEKT